MRLDSVQRLGAKFVPYVRGRITHTTWSPCQLGIHSGTMAAGESPMCGKVRATKETSRMTRRFSIFEEETCTETLSIMDRFVGI